MDLEAKGIKDMTELLVELESDNKKNMSEERDGSAGASSSVVRWERFLPKMVLRVLLVEGDDSTRQIIAALLRKCSYKVAAVSDGLKAWELLKGRPHNIDLILTEVDLPSISGCTLLTSIMEHEVCKNIPVIMMSSNDSVSTVYRCMLRGAADFLVKPVRKNELRNLWQHVWRRQASTGSPQGPLDESAAQQKVEATAENNACSNPSSGYEACVQRNRECIEKGSDAQSSCTKPELENEGENTEDIPESIQPNRNASLPNIDLRMSESDAGGVAPGEDSSTMIRREYVCSDDSWGHVRTTGQTSDNHPAPLTKQAIDLIGAFDNYLKCNFKSSGSNITTNDSSPLLNLSLTRSNPSGSVNQYTDEKHGLNHCDASAFSRYVNKAMQSSQSISAMTCNQQQNYETDSDKQFSSHSIDYNFDSRGPMTRPHNHVPPTCGEPGLGLPSPHKSSMPHPVPVRGIRFEGLNSAYSSMIAPLLYTPSGIPLHGSGSGSATLRESSYQENSAIPRESSYQENSATPRESSYQENSSTPRESSYQTNPTTSRESSYQTNPFIRLNCETRNSQQVHSPADQNNSNSITHNEGNRGHKSEPAIDCRNLPSTIDQSTNNSCCSSGISHLHLNCGSSENISLPTVKSQAECWKEEGSHTPDANSHQSQREAALLKFRMKRKDRCFDKKVRYESRKKLAEQRPRVKGQFVRQVPSELLSNS